MAINTNMALKDQRDVIINTTNQVPFIIKLYFLT